MLNKNYNMNISSHFEHPSKKQNKEYFSYLVRIAKSDDKISRHELLLLNRIGKKLGFTEPEIDILIEGTHKSDYIPPYELSKRFDQLYEIVKMSMADGTIDKNEMSLAKTFAVKSGFEEHELPNLLNLLINGISDNVDEEDLFKDYKKHRNP
jgi:uncharacterized tellurite resistance protein B-like protein